MISNSRPRASQSRAGEKGSALLIVLVFAAMLAIMLYKEMPVATFEAQRQKEQLLMDRGNEYKRAVKLYVRKFQTFPPSIDALENTNRMRFLRNRYVDPFTGKDDWRLLHAGPGGTIIDSKIKSTALGPNGQPGSNSNTNSSSSPLGAPSSVTNPFANSFDGTNPNGQPGAGNNFPQRPPAIAAGSAGSSGGGSDPMAGMASQGQDASQLAASTDPSQSGAANLPPNGGGPFPAAPVRFRGANPPGNSYPSGQFGGAGDIPPTPVDPQNTMQSLLNNSNPQSNPQNSSSQSAFGSNSTPSAFGSNNNGQVPAAGPQMGAMSSNMGGGIAGVASKAPGHTIKLLNDQKDRSLWEFVYDMQKEAQANAAGALGNPANGTPGTTNNNNGNSNNSGNSNSSFTIGSFGQSNSNGNTNQNSLSPSPPPQSTPPQSQ